VQVAQRAVFPPGLAKEDWAIFRALSATLGVTLPFNSLAELRRALYAEFPHLAEIDQIAAAGVEDIRGLARTTVATSSASYGLPIREFHLTNPIARASAVMGECAALAAGLRQAAE
jgi:NADH-quinone oxidoreductase subunit G